MNSEADIEGDRGSVLPMSWETAIDALDKRLPDFNNYLLEGYANDQINKIPEYVSCVFTEVAKQFNGDMRYLGYEALSPIDRVKFSAAGSYAAKSHKGNISVSRSELVLVRYKFEYQGSPIDVNLYVPYMFDNALVIEDTEYRLLSNIVERVISRTDNMVVIKVMRSPLMFWRKLRRSYANTEGEIHDDSIITCRIYFEKASSDRNDSKKTPLLLYLLARFGFEGMIRNFGIADTDLCLVPAVGSDTDEYEYFEIGTNIYLKAHRHRVMRDTDRRRIVASIVYIITVMKHGTHFTMEDLHSDQFYKIILGKNLRGDSKNDALACSDVQQHMDSLATYIDAYTRNELVAMDIPCEDIYQLLQAVFTSIDHWISRYSPNNLFDKRVAGVDFLLKDFVKSVYTRVYTINRKNKPLSSKDLSMFRFDPRILTYITHTKPPYMRQGSESYNDNEVMSNLLNRSRRDGTSDNSRNGSKTAELSLIHAPEHRLHISMIATESALAISSSKPCATGDMNPFAVIDTAGCFCIDQMPWVDDLLPLSRQLS